MILDELESLRREYNAPSAVDFKVPPPNKGVMDLEGYAFKATLYLTMFSSGLQLLFCFPIRDMLDLMGMALAQLHPNA